MFDAKKEIEKIDEILEILQSVTDDIFDDGYDQGDKYQNARFCAETEKIESAVHALACIDKIEGSYEDKIDEIWRDTWGNAEPHLPEGKLSHAFRFAAGLKEFIQAWDKAMQAPPKSWLVFDLETTGLDPENDEILQVSMIDGDGNTLLNSYVRPVRHSSWEDAQRINGITPEKVKDAPTIEELRDRVQDIFSSASHLLAYNGRFDMGFLRAAGIDIPSVLYTDVMLEFAPVYGEWSDYRNEYKWQKLTTAAKYYGYSFGAHDSLEDVKATLYVYNKIREQKGQQVSTLDIIPFNVY